MSYKNENEITIRVKCSENELIELLQENNFCNKSEYYAKDIFLIPNNIDIYKHTSRMILKDAILIREFQGISSNRNKKKITFKHKNINENGEILSQYSVNCEICNIEDAKELFKHIGYKELMETHERHYSYEKNDFKIIVKIIAKDNILIETETNEFYQTIDELKKAINKTNIPFDKSNYFVKKAEEELDKIKKDVK